MKGSRLDRRKHKICEVVHRIFSNGSLEILVHRILGPEFCSDFFFTEFFYSAVGSNFYDKNFLKIFCKKKTPRKKKLPEKNNNAKSISFVPRGADLYQFLIFSTEIVARYEPCRFSFPYLARDPCHLLLRHQKFRLSFQIRIFSNMWTEQTCVWKWSGDDRTDSVQNQNDQIQNHRILMWSRFQAHKNIWRWPRMRFTDFRFMAGPRSTIKSFFVTCQVQGGTYI